MSDRYDQNLLLDYLEGELPPDRAAEVDAMLERDPRLRQLMNRLAADREALRDLPGEDPPAAMVDDAIASLERDMLLGDPDEQALPLESRSAGSSRWRLSKALAYGSVAAAVLVSFAFVVHSLWQPAAPDPERVLADRQGPPAEELFPDSQPPALARRPDQSPSASEPARAGEQSATEPTAPAQPAPEALARAEAPSARANQPLRVAEPA
ncbi:MAG: hypothetical protein ACLFV3_10195, partial [Phycisphaeraceae bacterium]